MFRQMYEALHLATPNEALYLATLGGATALGLSDRIGSFAPGKDADFVVVSAPDLDLTQCDQKSIHEVYLQGRRVYF